MVVVVEERKTSECVCVGLELGWGWDEGSDLAVLDGIGVLIGS